MQDPRLHPLFLTLVSWVAFQQSMSSMYEMHDCVLQLFSKPVYEECNVHIGGSEIMFQAPMGSAQMEISLKTLKPLLNELWMS